MAFAESEIRSLAVLAHLSLSDEEVHEAAAHLERLLEYIARIQAIDVSEAHESVNDGDGPGVPLRPDVVRPGLPREVIMAAAPAAPLGLFEVPRVIIRSGTPASATRAESADDEHAP